MTGHPNRAGMTLPAHPGTYVLVLASPKTGPLRIGRFGTLELQEGFYVYVGSAFGPGGLQARLRHHLQPTARPHWHIDYLRAACGLIEVWFTCDAARQEHAWASIMENLPGATLPMPGFGSSDCGCAAHMFSFAGLPSIRAFRARFKSSVTVYRPRT